MALPEPARYCPRCGTALEGAPSTCPRDGYRWFPDPKVAVGVLIVHGTHEAPGTHGDHLLLVRRNHDPALRAWAFPSGFVDAGEVPEEAAVRTVRPETPVAVALAPIPGAWSDPGTLAALLAARGP